MSYALIWTQPKTKNFARIRAALLEEGSPVDTEVKREAEVVRQVRESETQYHPRNQSWHTAEQDSSVSQATVQGDPETMGANSEDDLVRVRKSKHSQNSFPPESLFA